MKKVIFLLGFISGCYAQPVVSTAQQQVEKVVARHHLAHDILTAKDRRELKELIESKM